MTGLLSHHKILTIISCNIASAVCILVHYIVALRPKKLSGNLYFTTVSLSINLTQAILLSFWSSKFIENSARLMEIGMAHTDSNYEYGWRLCTQLHERSGIKLSVYHTERGLFGPPYSKYNCCGCLHCGKFNFICITNAYFVPTKTKKRINQGHRA